MSNIGLDDFSSCGDRNDARKHTQSNLLIEDSRTQMIDFRMFRLSLIFAFICCFAHGRELERLTIRNGLANNYVYTCIQDHRGFLWFGTEGGLSRYDGANFINYQHNPRDPSSLSNDDVVHIFEDKNKTLWIATWGGGLNRYDWDNNRFFRYSHDPQNRSSISSNNIHTIFEDSREQLWIGTENGLNQFNWKTNEFTVYPVAESLSEDSHIFSIAQYEDKLYVGTRNGLFLFNLETKHWEPAPEILAGYLKNTHIRKTYIERERYLWVATDRGLFCLNFSSMEVIPYEHDSEDEQTLPSNAVTAIFEDHRRAIWVATEKGGLSRYIPTLDIFRPNPLFNETRSLNHIRFIYQDRSDIMWLCTRGGGVIKLDRKARKFRVFSQQEDGLSHPLVRALENDRRGNIWIATEGGGLNYFDNNSASFTQFTHDPDDPSSIPSNQITAVRRDGNDIIWFGSEKGLYSLGPNGADPISVPGGESLKDVQIHCLMRDGGGRLWIGSDYGLSVYQGSDVIHFRHNSRDLRSGPADNEIVTLFEDEKQMVWAGTKDQGVSVYDRNSGLFSHFYSDPNQPKGLGHNAIRTIHEYLGFIWIGTHGGGLDRYNPNAREFRHYLTNEGLPSNSIMGISDDGRGYLWISTTKGLAQFEPVQEIFKTYSVADGLQSNQFFPGSVLKNTDGEMFFGCVEGLTTFYPKLVKDNPYIPPIEITRVELPTLSDKNYAHLSAVKLNHKDNVVHFDFAALDFTQPSKNLYKFYLEGFDQDWSHETSRRSTSYTNLPHGTFTFRVVGSNNDGIWNENGASYQLIIDPPWYLSTWGYLLLFTVLLSFMISFGYLLKYRRNIRENSKIQIASEKIQAENNKAKRAFLANMSHELRIPITAIIGYAELIEEEADDHGNQKLIDSVHSDLHRIKSSAYSELFLVSNLIELSKLEADQLELYLTQFDVLSVVDEVLHQFRLQFEQKDNLFKFRVPDPIGDMRADRMKIQNIVVNLLTFANRNVTGGTVTLVVRRLLTIGDHEEGRREWITMVVTDTGPGIERETLMRLTQMFEGTGLHHRNMSLSMGVLLAQRFTSMMGGEFNIESEAGLGSKITVRIPVYVEPLS